VPEQVAHEVARLGARAGGMRRSEQGSHRGQNVESP
jgi:hypothetical protein